MEQYVSVAEVRDLVEEEMKERELNPAQKNALEHAKATAPLSAEDTLSLKAKILGIGIADMTETVALKIAELRPRYPVEVRAILQKERITLDEGQTQSILDAVAGA